MDKPYIRYNIYPLDANSRTTKRIGDKTMTVAEYIRLVAQIAILKEIAEEYPGKTIENIIAQLEARRNELNKNK